MRLLVVLMVLLALMLPAPPELLAQRRWRLPAAPSGPNQVETPKVGAPSSRSGPVKVMVELTDEPAVVAAARAVGPRPGQPSSSAFAAQAARVDRAQQSTLQALQSSGIRTQVLYRVQKAFNGIATVVDAADVQRIKAQPGVKSVRLLRPMKLSNTSTVPLINAPTAWTTAPGLTGQGMKIGIIDTGIDYLHVNFGGPGTPSAYGANDVTRADDTPGYFPNGPVVVGGYDFAGDAYDADSDNPAINTPHPDPDPMDCNGHGSHVAGSAAGRGVTTGNATYTGPYDTTVNLSSLKIGPGVAPAATLYALKVFGCDGSTLLAPEAIDWALDPNGDNDLSDHLDVVNMSLGSDFGGEDDATAVASNNAALAGMIVVAAAGNAGDTTGVAGAPASASRVISVAASDDGANRLDAFQTSGSIARTFTASASVDFGWSGTSVTAPAQYAGSTVSGCSAFTSGAFTGKIALIEWIPSGATTSPCGSKTRTNNAQNAGAVGVLLLYNQPSLDLSIAGNSTIPAMITDSTTAATLKANLTGLNVTFATTLLRTQSVVDATQVDKVASFTSRGPTTHTGGLKPDLSAPGVTVFSTANGTGTEGRTLSGTSMATPHVSGLMALLKQQHPTWTVEELKALAMTTANHDVFSGASHGLPRIETSRMGAGRIDAATAIASSLVAYETDDPGRVSVAFGAVESLGASSLTRTVKVVNKGGSSVNVNVSYSPISQVTGASISFPDGTSFSVPAGGSQTFRVQLSIDGAQLKNPRDPSMAATQVGNPRQYLAEVTGLVVVTPASGPVLRVPLYAAVRPASDMHATVPQIVPTPPATHTLNLQGTGVDTGATPSVDITSVVSAFELQAVSPPQPSSATPEQKAADLRYVGVASDGRVRGTVADSVLYFGLATELNWLRPSEEVVFSVLIDVNRDGTFDYELYNTELVDGSDDPTDVMVSALYNVDANTTTAETYLNVFDSTVPTAIFRNNVQVLSVPVSSLTGLTLANSRFNYKVNVYYGGVLGDSTGILTYDWLHPGADVMTAPGDTPFFYDLPGNSLQVTYSPAYLLANSSQGLLLLHHYNRDGQRAEVIAIGEPQTISFSPPNLASKALGDPPFPVSAVASSSLPVTIASQTPAVCTIDRTNMVTLVTTGTCTLRASQAGNSVYLPASADLTITVLPVPTACSPRPRVVVSTTRLDVGKLQVTVTAGNGTLQSIRFGTDTRTLQNGTVQIDGGSGPQQISAPTTVTLTPSVASKAFVVTRVSGGQAMTIPMVVTDGCGPWETFVGVGAGG